MTKVFRFGVIGCGLMGREFASAAARWLHLSNPAARPEIVAVCDTNASLMDWFADNVPTVKQRTTDYRELLARQDLDAVLIATPDHWHAKMAIEALDRGKDVYLEKPMTRTADEAKRIYEKVRDTKRVLQVGSQTTSSDQWWKVRKAIQDGLIGKLIIE